MNHFDESNVKRDQGKFASKAQSAPAATLKPMTALVHPYPAAPFDPTEVAQEASDDPGALVCFCGNSADNSGFAAADREGRLASIQLDSSDRGDLGVLPDGHAMSICNFCGRIYDNGASVAGAPSPVVGRIDRDAPTADDAWELYYAHNFG
jgi:hypothetical protein